MSRGLGDVYKRQVLYTVESLIEVLKNSGADAVGGHTRSHPEHDG